MRLFAMLLALSQTFVSAAAQEPVKVSIQWDYKDFPGEIVLHEAKQGARLWDTRGVATLGDAPVGKRIENAVLSVTPGQNRRFVLVVHNSGKKPLYFFAAPHAVHPAEHTLGFKFKCLCIDHAFTVAPGASWYRVVELRLAKDFVGKELTVRHAIIGIDKLRASSFSNKPAAPDL
jgi:hypothetical protein